MSEFLSGDYWEGDRSSGPRTNIEEGRYILYRYKCPLCGSITCRVKKKSNGYPVLYCETHKKWIECVYKFI